MAYYDENSIAASGGKEPKGAAGTGEYEVRPGDCMSSIAKEAGFYWKTLWDHPANTELKNARKDPNVLLPGDRVHIPERQVKEFSRGTEKRHRFRLKGTPAKLRLRILEEPKPKQTQRNGAPPALPRDLKNVVTEDPMSDTQPLPDKPRANVPYLLIIDGTSVSGKTDRNGMIQCSIPPDAKEGQLILEPGTLNETILPLLLGHLDPLSDVSGVKHRLANLGFDSGDQTDEATPDLAAALRAFQEKHGLQVTGEIDQPTRDKLRELHGG